LLAEDAKIDEAVNGRCCNWSDEGFIDSIMNTKYEELQLPNNAVWYGTYE